MYYSIGEFSKLIGVSTYTLRLWEKNGKLRPHHRTQGNQRVYTEAQVQEYLLGSVKKEAMLIFERGVLKRECINDLTEEEIDQVMMVLKQIKEERSSNR